MCLPLPQDGASSGQCLSHRGQVPTPAVAFGARVSIPPAPLNVPVPVPAFASFPLWRNGPPCGRPPACLPCPPPRLFDSPWPWPSRNPRTPCPNMAVSVVDCFFARHLRCLSRGKPLQVGCQDAKVPSFIWGGKRFPWGTGNEVRVEITELSGISGARDRSGNRQRRRCPRCWARIEDLSGHGRLHPCQTLG